VAVGQQFRVEIPETDYWRKQIKCQDACPVHTDARGYVRAIADGEYELAYLIARGPNPLASLCGLICGAPCEVNCRRGSLDSPIAIRPLKRFVADRFGPDAWKNENSFLKDYLAKRIVPQLCESRNEIRRLLENSERIKADSAKVAIIGSGPAGLGCAHDLALLGITPVIFEMEKVPAGMLYVGVPEYRLPRELIKAEVGVIESLGVEIRCGVEVGKDISFDALREEYDAIVIAVGAKRSRILPIPGVQGPYVMGGVDFLRDVALRNPVRLNKRVVVVGGGNVAFDVGRTVLRQAYYDMARTAVRQEEVAEVHLCCLESFMEMPADDVEIAEGAEEGINLHPSLGPKEILRDSDGKVTAVVFQKVLQVYDENKKFSPVFDSSVLTTLECDTVLLAVGQASDISFVEPQKHGIEISDRGIPTVDPDTLAATAQGVFFAGDVAHGPGVMIGAIASGKQAARSVYEHVTGNKLDRSMLELHIDLPGYAREKGYERLARVEVPTSDVATRIRNYDMTVETGYKENEARLEASRCLDCGVNTIFNSEKCVLCGGCADVCPTLCLRLVSLENLEQDEDLQKLVEEISGEALNSPLSAIIKDEERCIRCACCARRCPTGAITMERYCFQES
jgi:NADPH-dependent glutamate synthase beta subunit-like oxidoreductase